MLILYRDLIHLSSKQGEVKSFSSHQLFLIYLTVFNLSHSVALLHLFLSPTVIFMVTALLNLLTAFLSLSLPHPNTAASLNKTLLTLTAILSTLLMRELISIFTLSSLSLVKFSIVPSSYDLNYFKRPVQRQFFSLLKLRIFEKLT